MSTKLTLSLKKEIIEKAKAYAKDNQVSLSFLIENYLQKLITSYKIDKQVQDKESIVNELSGIIKLDAGIDYKQELSTYLNQKYQ